jgi:hypothetical protein
MNIGIPTLPRPIELPEIKSPAEYAFLTVQEQVKAFEASLTGTEAVGVWVASFGRAFLIQVQSIKQNGQFFVFEGWNEEREECQVIQHFTQVSLMLTKMKPAVDKRPIGFVHA